MPRCQQRNDRPGMRRPWDCLENSSMHDAAGLVAQQLGIPTLATALISISNSRLQQEAPEEEVETPSPRDSTTLPNCRKKPGACARARARQEASRKLTDEEATHMLFEEQKRRIDWLEQVPIFKDVSSKSKFIEDLAKRLQVRTVRKGTVIIRGATWNRNVLHRTWSC